MTYDIKRLLNGVETLVKTVHPTGSQSKKAMGESVVDMSFTLPVYVDFKINDFVEVYGETYKINLTPSVKKVAKRKYEYQIQFEHLFYDLAKVQLQGLNASNGYLEPVFNIMANAATIIGLVVENANRHSPGWTVGVVDDTAYQNYSFSAENCLQVLNRLASDFETEFWIEGKTIHLQKREQSSGLQFEYGQGKGLYSISRNNKTNTNIITRLYVRGGSRNLPLDYRDYATSLLLPGGLTYIQDNNKVALYGLIESTQVFDGIFPQREGTISAVVAGDDNWKYFTDASLDFDVNAYKLPTPAKVAFNTGQLAGYIFEISDYNHATKTFTINQNTDASLTVPTNLLRPAVGDKYVLLDIKMPQNYVDAEENRLLVNAQAYYDKNSDPALNFSYAVDCDPIWFAQQNVTVVLGNTVVVYDVDLGINGEIRIAGYKRDLQTASKYELEISDSIGASEIVRQYAQQQRTLQLIESSGLLDINQIRKNIFLNRLSEQNGYLMLSGVKAKAGLADLATNALHADLADYALDADKWDGRQFSDYLNQPLRTTDDVRFKSITSTSYVSGALGSGFKIDENGDAVFDNLTVRKQFNVYELVVNKIRATNGALAVTDALVVKSVVRSPNYVKVFSDDVVPFEVNDILRCQVFTGTSIKLYYLRALYIDNTMFEASVIQGSEADVAVGDTLVRMGNVSDANRQGLLYLTASDSGAPYLDVLDGVTSTNLAGKTKVRLGKLDGITDADLGNLSGYGLYGQNVFVKGKIHVTGGNAQTIAGSQALADVAKAQAIATASLDAQTKADQAQANAQAMVEAVKVGGRNILIGSSNGNGWTNHFSGSEFRKTSSSPGENDYIYSPHFTLEPGREIVFSFEAKQTDNINSCDFFILGNYDVEGFVLVDQYAVTANWTKHTYKITVPTSILSPVQVRFDHNGSLNGQPATIYIRDVKIEYGNQATDWTPAPEDVDQAVADAKTAGDLAQAQNAALTASLKSMAYKDVVALADLGSTIIEGGKVKTTLLDADYIRSNIVNAGYVNTLELDAAAIKSGTIDSERINAAQIVSNGGGATVNFVNTSIGTATTQAEADATAKASAAQVAAIQAAANDASAKVAGIQLGGRNLLPDSSFENGVLQPWGLSGLETMILADGALDGGATHPYLGTKVLYLAGDNVTAGGDIYVYLNKPIKLIGGETYTISFYYVGAGSIVGCSTYVNFNSTGHKGVGFSLIGDKVWRRMTYTFVCDPADTSGEIRFGFTATGFGWMAFDAIKVEKGNKVSDWTPAPEDADFIATQKAEAAQLAATNAAYAQAAYEREIAKAYADGIVTAEEQARIAQAESNLQAAKDDAQQKVNAAIATANGYTDTKALTTISAAQTYADGVATTKANAAQANAISQASTDAQNKANAAQAAAALLSQQLIDSLKIGGRNLLRDGSFENGVLGDGGGYAINGYVNPVDPDGNPPKDGIRLFLTHNYNFPNQSDHYLEFNQNIPLVGGKEYTLSFYHKSAGSITGSSSYYYDSLGGVHYIPVVFSPYNGWIYFSWTFTPPVGVTSIILRVGYGTNGVDNAWVCFDAIKVEEGNKATAYTPAPEDVQAAIDNAKALVDAANASYATLTASLKSMAYKDVEEFATEFGSTIIENGKVKTTLLDADYIKSNIVNAAYINTLEIITKNLKTATTGKRVEIDSVNNNIRVLDADNKVLIEIDDDSALISFNASGQPIYGAGMMIGDVTSDYMSLSSANIQGTGNIIIGGYASFGKYVHAVNLQTNISNVNGSLPDTGLAIVTGNCNLYTYPDHGQLQTIKNRASGNITVSAAETSGRNILTTGNATVFSVTLSAGAVGRFQYYQPDNIWIMI